MNKKPLIFLAGAYKGDREQNTKLQLELFAKLMQDGVIVPYAPLVVGHQVIQHLKISEEDWEAFDKEILQHCDGLLRYNKDDKSKGADAEEEYTMGLKKPVFYSVRELYAYVIRGIKPTPEFMPQTLGIPYVPKTPDIGLEDEFALIKDIGYGQYSPNKFNKMKKYGDARNYNNFVYNVVKLQITYITKEQNETEI